MGQRTATFVSYINTKGEKSNKAYYCGWGIGRVQLMALMGNFLAQIGCEKFDLSGSNHSFIDESDCHENINNLDFSNITDVKDLSEFFDNNNGGIVFICDDTTHSSKIGFLLGEEECRDTDDIPFSRFVTFDEWKEKVGGKYVDESFTYMFFAFCKHFNVSIM